MSKPATPLPAHVENTSYSATAAKRIILIYAAFASFWILASDNLVSWLVNDPVLISRISIAKGWLFVAVTSLMLYGLIRRMQSRAQDISDRELTVQKDRAAIRRLLDNIVESSSDAIYAKDTEGRYLLFNQETARLLGQTTDKALGKDDAALFPKQAAMIRANDQRVMSEDRVISFEETVATTMGERTFLVTKGPLREADGQVRGLFGISRDITERKQAEHRLITSELQMRALFQAIPDLVWLKGTEGAYLSCNSRFEQLFGAAEADIVGKTDYDFVDKELADFFRKNDQLAMQKGIPCTNEEWVTFASDGHRELLETTKTPVRNAQGQVIGVLGLGHDITERKRMHDRLIAAQEDLKRLNQELESKVALRTQEFQDLYDHAPCGYHSLSPEGLILRANQAELNMLGYTSDEYIGHPIAEFMTPESTRVLKVQLPQVLQQGYIRNLQVDFVCKDGSTRPFLVDANLVRDASGAPLFTRSTMVDNTERKAQTNQIETLNNLLQEVVETLPYGVVVLDETRQVRLKNSRVSRLLDYPADFFEPGQVSFSEMIAFNHARGDYADRPFNEVLTFFTQAMITQQTIKFERRQANGVFLEVCGVPMSNGWTLLTYTDISAHKQAQQTLDKAMHAAEAATVAKSAFIANVSHELRTPMNAILGLSYLLEKMMSLPGDASDLVRKIRQSSTSLMGMLNDVLDFSKIESGKLNLQSAPFRLGDILNNLAGIMSTNARDKDLEVIIAPTPIGTSQLIGDSLRLEQVLINLTGNAIKFTAQGHVALNIIKLHETSDSISLRFAVSDSGIGIAPEQQQEIFAEFSQADGSISRQFGGTGLGLTISRRLVEAMGGELKVTSVLGRGSEFWFVLTFQRIEDALAATPDMAHLSVVIADDNAIARAALHTIADGLGWRASVFESGDEVIDHLNSRPPLKGAPEVLLLDFKMPGKDGLETARAIREGQSGQVDPIVILVTAYANDELLGHPQAHLADAILSKPVTPSTLYDAVTRAMRVRRGAETQAPAHNQSRLAGLRILVVDDSDINREVAQRIFVSEGALVSLANNGQEAMDWLQNHDHAVDLVLMDVQMPVLNGYEATRQIRRIPALSELPIVALTAGAFRDQQELAHEAGMTSFISKPFDVDTAVALIVKLTGHVVTPAAQATTDARPSPDVSPEELPGIALSRGLEIWRDIATYQRFLRLFASKYADVVAQLASLDNTQGAALLHKLKGAAANMALLDVATSAAELEAAVRVGASRSDGLTKLQAAMDSVLVSIALFAPDEVGFAARDVRPEDAGAIDALITKLQQAWHSDSAKEVRQTLTELGTLVPSSRLAQIQAALDNYDFRVGETATLELRTQLAALRQET
ncbi:PAS domain-containing protein [Rhodoferax sp. U11-2br]|uniref:PAS domain-containing hybrid sensor histidine kinase/response regulator n=1 Tax=Rhodoferax sp. U11-2br TaxID=2838878 RepID=UPI001BED3835|nr:PAS domain-containing protein [Rhodoferax sp. U11-2br]MBT3067437.1 PAS domain-containing protein [Rhodoferax sp. U11-2br]